MNILTNILLRFKKPHISFDGDTVLVTKYLFNDTYVIDEATGKNLVEYRVNAPLTHKWKSFDNFVPYSDMSECFVDRRDFDV